MPSALNAAMAIRLTINTKILYNTVLMVLMPFCDWFAAIVNPRE